MITKIIIHNFQCHKDITLELGRSTVLQGNSNSGKTAVLRALYWVLFNNAPGDFVSYWAQKKTKSGFKFKDDEYTSVTVEVDGHTIERKRSNDFNGYIVDGHVFEALRTAVPEEVTRLFNLSEASIQRQMDAPFLLAATPGEASQYLNNLAGLGCVDEILTIAKRKVADTSSLVENTNEEIDRLDKEVNSYGWVKHAEKYLQQATDTQKPIEDLEHRKSSLSGSLNAYKAIKDYPEIPDWLENGDKSEAIRTTESEIETLEKYISACKVLNRVTPALDGLSALKAPEQPQHTEKEFATLSSSVREYKELANSDKELECTILQLSKLKEPKPCKWDGKLLPLKVSVDKYVHLSDIDNKVSQVLSSLSKLKEPKPCKWTEKELTALIRSIRSYKGLVNTIADCRDYLDDAYDSLKGAVCPVCGRPLDGDTCFM